MRPLRKKIIIPLGVALAVAAGTGTWALTRPPATSDPVTYRSATASTGTIRLAVSATGTIEPRTVDDLNFTSGGRVTAVNVAVGQPVTAGQALATISSATLQSAVASAQANLASANARLAADQSAGASDAQLDADNANITVAQAQLADAQAALAGATITSPIDGTVTAVNVTVGQQLGSSGGPPAATGSSSAQNRSSDTGSGAGSSSTSSGSAAAIQVISTGSYVVNASVDSTDIALVKEGNQVVITPAGATANVVGVVSSVGIVATTTSGVASFPVVAEVTGSPAGLFAGATASLQIVYKQLTDVLVVPALAVNRSGGTPYVLVPDGESRARRDVVIGLSSGGQTQIVSGLAEGDVVLIAVPSGNGGDTGGTGGAGGRGTGGNRDGVVPGGGKGVIPSGGPAPVDPGSGGKVGVPGGSGGGG
ncbi:MAG TPA: biotin/lipoyl-binding protein [Pseudonocardiaceae bacterium]